MHTKRKFTHCLAVLIIGIAVLPVTDVFGETAGNVDGIGTVDLKDVILSLQVCAGASARGTVPDADVNGDGRIGLAEAVYGLQVVAEIRDFIVVFPDANLEYAVRIKIGKPEGDIFASDLRRITVLGGSMGVANIEGLQYCTNMTEFSLLYNQIIDISPLAGLTNLTKLYFDGNQIIDISPLAGLTNVTELSLYGDKISDISPLAGLTNLTELSLHGNKISDTSPLAGLANLTELSLNGNFSDISPLAGLANLTELYLNSNQISDISPLAGLTSLTELYLHDNQISDIKPLVDNSGIGTGDYISFSQKTGGDNPLNTTSCTVYVPQLRNRGVSMSYSCTYPIPLINYRHISPKILFSFGISGAIQHTAAIHDADFIIAVNKNPNATMMKIADVAIVADASQVCSALIRELKQRIRN